MFRHYTLEPTIVIETDQMIKGEILLVFNQKAKILFQKDKNPDQRPENFDYKKILETKQQEIDFNYVFVISQTNFYAEKGGQVSDIGKIEFGNKNFTVKACQWAGNVVLHFVQYSDLEKPINEMMKALFLTDQKRNLDKKANKELPDEDPLDFEKRFCKLFPDITRRQKTRMHHTATHLLNHLIHNFIGGRQSGSLVDPDKLRFDYTGGKFDYELVELTMQKSIKQKRKVLVETVSRDEIIRKKEESKKGSNKATILHQTNDLMSYPSEVRVIYTPTVLPVEKTEEEKKTAKIMKNGQIEKYNFVSVPHGELCGGLHVNNTGDIVDFLIINDQTISSGIRRVTAICGEESQKLRFTDDMQLRELQQGLDKINEILDEEKNSPEFNKMEKKTEKQPRSGLDSPLLVKDKKTLLREFFTRFMAPPEPSSLIIKTKFNEILKKIIKEECKLKKEILKEYRPESWSIGQGTLFPYNLFDSSSQVEVLHAKNLFGDKKTVLKDLNAIFMQKKKNKGTDKMVCYAASEGKWVFVGTENIVGYKCAAGRVAGEFEFTNKY